MQCQAAGYNNSSSLVYSTSLRRAWLLRKGIGIRSHSAKEKRRHQVLLWLLWTIERNDSLQQFTADEGTSKGLYGGDEAAILLLYALNMGQTMSLIVVHRRRWEVEVEDESQ